MADSTRFPCSEHVVVTQVCSGVIPLEGEAPDYYLGAVTPTDGTQKRKYWSRTRVSRLRALATLCSKREILVCGTKCVKGPVQGVVAQCQYTVALWANRFDLQLLIQIGNKELEILFCFCCCFHPHTFSYCVQLLISCQARDLNI